MQRNGTQPRTSGGCSDLETSCERPDPPNKRRNAGETPERYRVGQTHQPRLLAAAAGDTSAQPRFEAHIGGQAAPCPSTSKRSVRNIFMTGGRAPEPPPLPHERPAWSVPSSVLPDRSPDLGDDGAGPLTQMAAANASVAAAFCPTCGCFMADLGSAAEKAQHAQSCGAHSCAGSAGPPARGEACALSAQRDQAASVAAGAGDAGASAELSWDDDGEQGGNWSEEEEATQAGGCAGNPLGAAGPSSHLGGFEPDVEEHGCSGAGEVIDLAGGDGGDDGGEFWAEEEAAGGGGDDLAALAAWLEHHRLAKYTSCFVAAGVGLSQLARLTDRDLQQLGVVALGARKKVLLAVEGLAGEAAAAAPSPDADGARGDERWAEAGHDGGLVPACGQQEQQQEERQPPHAGQHFGGARSGVGDWRALAAGGGGPALVSCNIRQYFKPVGGGKPPPAAKAGRGSILSFVRGPDGEPLPPRAAEPATGGGRGRGRGQQWAHKAVAAEGGGGGGKRWGPRAAQVLPMRPWQVVPGTLFVVDRFCNLPAAAPHRHWFLTHFHADHYKGLTGRFDRGTLYCTPPTARLVQQQLRVRPACIRQVPLNTPMVVEGVRITFLEANHCPGAAMILFEPPRCRPVLHTGDCRLVAEMQLEGALQAVRGRAHLILDTTYCSPEYAFPPQADVLRFAIDAVKAEAFNPRTLFLFGSYTIGKERLFLEAARVLQRKVYVSVAKRKILDCLDLPPQYSGLLTTDDGETNLHAVPLWMVSQKHMAKLLKHYRGRFSTAVGFQPTGWTHQRDAGQTRARGRRRQKGTLITYQVPYSEHSSFSELREFVRWFAPASIIPSVNSDSDGPKARRLVQLLHDETERVGR